MNIFHLLLSLLTLAVSPFDSAAVGQAAEVTTASAQTSTPLEVMTYNIRTGKARDGLDAWAVRHPRTLQIIKKYNPDVIGLQEADNFQVADLQTSMPGYVVVGSGRKDGRTDGELSAILYRTARLQLLRSDTFWLSDTPDTPGTTHWGNIPYRVCTWAHFYDLKTRKYFYFFNTHLDHISQPSRTKSVALIIDRIRHMQPKEAVIITGDFNAAEQNPAISTIRTAGYRDSFRVLHPDETNVGTTNAFQEKRHSNKIDYIFIDDSWEVNAAKIPEDKIDNRWPSDHLPVTATLTQK